jgi:dipeptidyl aminopeptidase/acylaminoacyl peptidase
MLLAASAAAGQTPRTPEGPPDTEIYLAGLHVSGTTVTIDAPTNITSSPGYDNQPSFTPDGRAIFFTSVRGGGRLPDIYRYDIRSRQTTHVTQTPEGEYSPTVTPDGQHISVVRVEADATQRLWRFTLDGKRPELVLRDVKPVGYHTWADDHTLVLFVLGDPVTLQVADTRTGRAAIVMRGVGRSIQRMPNRHVSFVEREPAPEPGGAPVLWIRELDPKTQRVMSLVRAVPGATEADCAWTPSGLLMMAYAGTLYTWRSGDAGWTRVADLAALGLKGVTRIAVSPKGDRIAFVTAGS